jgi:iron complex transport system ATP-binding protein
MRTPVAEVKGLECGYGDKVVLHGLNIQVMPGERVALLGPNGSGKSTLLRALAGLVRPRAGEIFLGSQAISKLSVREIAQRVATVPQEEIPRFDFTVRDAVTMGCLARSSSLHDTPEDRAEASRAMEMADCIHLAERPVTELSGGERQRVLIARALAQRAPLVLLDEPTSHLDPAHQVGVSALVGSLASNGIATVAAVHDLNFAARIADRAVLLEEGRVALNDTVEEVLNSPILDRVYGVGFLRSRFGAGAFLVLP